MTANSKSFQSECQLLGSMVLDPTCTPEAVKIVPDSGYFESPENRIIFDLLMRLYQEKSRPDLIILRNRLEQQRQLKSAGGVDYLVRIVEATATPANFAIHARHVRDCYLERRLAGMKEAIRRVESEPGTVAEKINTVSRDFAELQDEVRPRPLDNPGGLDRLLDDTIAGRRQAIKTGWPLLDSLSRCLMPGTLTLLCGNPGASKSFMLLQLLSHLTDSGVPAAVLELEESREFHTLRALAQRAGISGLTDPDWMKANPDESWSAYHENKPFIESLFQTIEAPDCQQTFSQIAGWIREKSRHGARFIAVDPITAVQTTRQDVWSEHNDFLQSVKQIAVEYNTVLLFITHPVKSVSIPDINQLAGSAAFGRFSQSALWLEHIEAKNGDVKTLMGTIPTEYNRILHILKCRNGSGQGVRIACLFNRDDLCLKEMGIIVKNKESAT